MEVGSAPVLLPFGVCSSRDASAGRVDDLKLDGVSLPRAPGDVGGCTWFRPGHDRQAQKVMSFLQS